MAQSALREKKSSQPHKIQRPVAVSPKEVKKVSRYSEPFSSLEREFVLRSLGTMPNRRDMLDLQSIQNILGSQGKQGFDLVWRTAEHNEVEIMARMIRIPGPSAMVRRPNPFGITPLLMAAHRGYSKMVETMLRVSQDSILIPRTSDLEFIDDYEKSLDPEARALMALSWSEGITPLWAAAFGGHIDVVKILLATPQGLKTLHQPDKQGATPLLIAAFMGHMKVASFLLAKSKEERGGLRGLFSPIPHLELVQMLMDNTAILHAESEFNFEELEESFPILDISVYPQLMARGRGWSILGVAVEEGMEKLVKALLKTELGRSNIKLKGYGKGTPLYIAAKKGYLEIVKDLLKTREGRASMNKPSIHSANLLVPRGLCWYSSTDQMVDLSASSRLYPLGAAISGGHLEVVEEFLKLKEGRASLNRALDDEQTRILAQIAKRELGLEELAELPPSSPAWQEKLRVEATHLMHAISVKRPGIVMRLLQTPEGQASTLHRNLKNFTALLLAVEWGNIEVVTRLLDIDQARQTINWRAGRHGFTPLLMAAWHNRIELGALLLSRGANIAEDEQRLRKALTGDRTLALVLTDQAKWRASRRGFPLLLMQAWENATLMRELLESLEKIKQHYAYMFPTLGSYLASTMDETSLLALQQAKQFFKIGLTKIYAHAMTFNYNLMTGNNQIHAGKAASMVISVLFSFIPVPGISLLSEAARHAGSLMASEGGSSLAKRTVVGQDKAKYQEQLGKIETLDQAARHMMALVDTLLYRFQWILLHLDPDSIPVFVRIVIEIMMDHSKSMAKKIQELGLDKEILGAGLIDIRQPLDGLPPLPTDPEQQFANCIANIVMGTALWESPQPDDLSGLIAERVVKLQAPQGVLNVTVRSLCQDGPVITWVDEGEGVEPSFFECIDGRRPRQSSALNELLPPRILSPQECKLLGYERGNKLAISALAVPPPDLTREKTAQQMIEGLQAELAATQVRNRELESRLVDRTVASRITDSPDVAFFAPAEASSTARRRPLEMKPLGNERLSPSLLT